MPKFYGYIFMRERYLNFDLASLGFWLIVAFCFLRSVEVLVLQGSVPYIQYSIALAGFLYFFVSVRFAFKGSLESLRLGYGFVLPAALLVTVSFQILSFDNVFDEFGRASHGYLIQTTFVILAWFYAGGLVASKGAGGGVTKWPIYLIFLSLLVMVLLVTNFGLSIPYSSFQEDGAFEVMNHLLLAEYMLLICYAAYVLSGASYRPVVFFLMAYIMFAGGGRASFLIGVMSVVAYEYFYGERRVFWLICFLIFVLVFFVGAMVDFSDDAFRYMLFSSGVDQDNSYIGRVSQVEAGLGNLINQVFFGDISFLVKKFNNLGSYIHNFISAWQFYGVFVFLLCLWLIFCAAKKILWVLRSGHVSVMDSFFLLVFIYSIISVLFVKHVGFSSFWYALGYWVLQGRTRIFASKF